MDLTRLRQNFDKLLSTQNTDQTGGSTRYRTRQGKLSKRVVTQKAAPKKTAKKTVSKRTNKTATKRRAPSKRKARK